MISMHYYNLKNNINKKKVVNLSSCGLLSPLGQSHHNEGTRRYCKPMYIW